MMSLALNPLTPVAREAFFAAVLTQNRLVEGKLAGTNMEWRLSQQADRNLRLTVSEGLSRADSFPGLHGSETRYEFSASGEFLGGERQLYRWSTNQDGQDVLQSDGRQEAARLQADKALRHIARGCNVDLIAVADRLKERILSHIRSVLGEAEHAKLDVGGLCFELRSVHPSLGGGYYLSSSGDYMGRSLGAKISPDGSMEGFIERSNINGFDCSAPIRGLQGIIEILESNGWRRG